MQKLSIVEEEAIRAWLLELSSWGWTLRFERLRAMATELLMAKGDTRDLGVHWTDHSLRRYPELKSKFVAGLDKERGEAQDPDIHHLLLYCPCFVGWNIVVQLTPSRTLRAAPYKWPISGFVGAALAIFFGGKLINLISSYMTKLTQGR
jgi:hypothetical protein